MALRMKFYIEYVPFYLFVKTISFLPFNASLWVGRQLGRLAYAIDKRHRMVAMGNLTAVLGLSESDAKTKAKAVFENLGVIFAEFVRVPAINNDFLEKNVIVEGFDSYQNAKAEGKGVLMLGAHFGSWEFNPVVHLLKMGEEASVVYKNIKNPYVDRFIDSVRKSYGLKTIQFKNSIKEIMAALKRGEGVGILLDQFAEPDEAVIVDFMGKPAYTSYGLALIARKTGAPVVPMFVMREGKGRYRAVYEEAIHVNRTDDSEKDIRDATIKFNMAIEKYVRKYPEQWFWVHRRWKKP